jgi:site-specific recombinase XerD
LSGRYEKEMKIEQQVMKKLQAMPSILMDYYYSLIGSGKSYRTAKAYIDNVVQFINFTYNGNCAEDFYINVKSNHINKYISSLRTKSVKGKTERTSDSHKGLHWSSLNSFFQFLIPEYISNNPVANTTRPKVRDNPEVTFLTVEEIARIFDNVKERASVRMLNRDLCLLKLGFATGLRISAIVQIDINDLDLEHNRIRITEKGDKDVYVMIGDNLKSQILLWLQDRNEYFKHINSDALFVSQENNRLSSRSVKDLIDKYTLGATDKHVTPHVMRHSCATNLYEATGDIYLCAKQLNHKNVSTTQRYAELSKEKQKKAANILDDMI